MKEEASGLLVTELNEDKDVVLGRGNSARVYAGTRRYHELLKQHSAAHHATKKLKEKDALARQAVQSVESQGGRFLRHLLADQAKKYGHSGSGTAWVVIESEELLKKIKQGLRDTWRTENTAASSKSHSKTIASQVATPEIPLFSSSSSQPPALHSSSSAAFLQAMNSSPLLNQNPHVGSHVMSSVMPPPHPTLNMFTMDEYATSHKKPLARKVSLQTSTIATELRTTSANLPTVELGDDVPEEIYHECSQEEHEAAAELLSVFTGDTPHLTAQQILQEKEQLTREERQAALCDVFGESFTIGHQDVRRKKLDPGTMASLLRDVRQEIDHIAPSEKKALYEAIQRASILEFSEKRLEQFLQCEKKDPAKAARRFVDYWEFRREWFGEDKFCLPLTLEGAFRDDYDIIKSGTSRLLPGLDDSGRSIVYYPSMDHSKDPNCVVRAYWYVLERAAFMSPGIVILYTSNMSDFWNFNMKVAKAFTTFQKSLLPATICASHQIGVPKVIRAVFIPILLAMTSKDIRSRIVVHDQSCGPELVECFESYGIPKALVPTDFGGQCNIDLSAWSEWLAKQREQGN